MSNASQHHRQARFDLRVLTQIDDLLERRTIRDMLEQLGCAVSQVSDTKVFLKHNSDFDLLISSFDRGDIVSPGLRVSRAPSAAGTRDHPCDTVARASEGNVELTRPVRLRDLVRVLESFDGAREVESDRRGFASLLDPSVVRSSALQLADELRAFLEFPSIERPHEGARKAHAFISTAVVLELCGLARACQDFEATVAGGGDCCQSLERLNDEIQKALVALGARI